MTNFLAVAAVGFALAAATIPPAAEGQRKPELPCGDELAFQVLLDREGFSPGQIDGKIGTNATHALTAFQTAHDLPSGGEPDCDTWHALGGETSGPTTVDYQIVEDDLKGPFEKSIPRDLEQQAKLPAMSYRSPLDRLSERCHASPVLLRRMNPLMKMTAGERIQVPAVPPFDADAKPARNQTVQDLIIEMSGEESALRAKRADNTLLFFAPVSSGSVHDPLPVGDWKVKSVDWHPVFHYNPKLFWDANPSVKPGTPVLFR